MVKMTLVTDADALQKGEPGTFMYDADLNLAVKLPCHTIHVFNVTDPGRRDHYQISGRQDAPTLYPAVSVSTFRKRDGMELPLWRGWIRAGHLVDV